MVEWFQLLSKHFSFPRDYTTIDLETSGLMADVHSICVIGHTVVRDGKPVETKETYINWWADPDTDIKRLELQLQTTELIMRANNKTFLHTKEKLQALGRPPKEVFEEYLKLFEEMEDRGEVLVSHNGIAFDLPFLVAHFHNVLRVGWKFREDLVFDTGVMLKASQMATVPQPKPDETFYQFLKRVSRTPAKGIFWALDKYCEPRFGLCKQAGVDPTLAHTAGVDSLLTAYLYEEQRKLAQVNDSK
jgi:DNA polymerase III epsilon subunit-like protein